MTPAVRVLVTDLDRVATASWLSPPLGATLFEARRSGLLVVGLTARLAQACSAHLRTAEGDQLSVIVAEEGGAVVTRGAVREYAPAPDPGLVAALVQRGVPVEVGVTSLRLGSSNGSADPAIDHAVRTSIRATGVNAVVRRRVGQISVVHPSVSWLCGLRAVFRGTGFDPRDAAAAADTPTGVAALRRLLASPNAPADRLQYSRAFLAEADMDLTALIGLLVALAVPRPGATGGRPPAAPQPVQPAVLPQPRPEPGMHRPRSWPGLAACLTCDPELFFPLGSSGSQHEGTIYRAKQVCAGCLVREDCLTWALEHGEDGIWGETTAEERRTMRRRRRRESQRESVH